MHFNPSTSLLKIVTEKIYIDVQTCIHSVQGFSLFKVVLLCDVTSNTMLFLLKSKGTAIYYFSFQNQKKKMLWGLWKVSGVYQKATFSKWQHQNFCSWSQNWFYATFFPLFCFWCYRLSSMSVRWDGADAFKLILKGQVLISAPHPAILFIHPVVVLQNEGPLSCGWNKRNIHLSSDCPHRENATPGL